MTQLTPAQLTNSTLIRTAAPLWTAQKTIFTDSSPVFPHAESAPPSTEQTHCKSVPLTSCFSATLLLTWRNDCWMSWKRLRSRQNLFYLFSSVLFVFMMHSLCVRALSCWLILEQSLNVIQIMLRSPVKCQDCVKKKKRCCQLIVACN